MKSKLSPLMAQYQEIKDEYSEGILFFQVGDFYETFYDDARKVSRLLNIALTSRDKKNPVPLAGVPMHAAGAYISKLLQAGEKVVICDQIEKPGEGKGIVRRKVTDIITPGTCLEPSTLDEKTNNYIAAVTEVNGKIGFSVIDLSTGEFHSMEGTPQMAENLLSGYIVREALIPDGSSGLVELIRSGSPTCSIEEVPPYRFNIRETTAELLRHFGVNNLSCFGIEDRKLAVSTAGVLLRHVKELRQSEMAHVSGIRYIVPEGTLFLDPETVRNLELVEPMRGDSPESTLIRHIDRTRTAAGARMLRSWLMHPSRIKKTIERRLDGVSSFSSDQIRLREFRKALSAFPDIERLLSRITTGKAGPRDVLSLGEAMERLPALVEACIDPGDGIIREKLGELSMTVEAGSLVVRSISPDAPSKFKDGGVIRKGFDEDLDRLIEDSEGGRKWVARLQARERERTGIPSLKVGYNKVFGYYIEVSRIHEEKIPEDYTCKQSLVASQRYISGELKAREQEILTADSRRIELEKEIFGRICTQISMESQPIQTVARAIAVLDALSAL
ncbi:MAG TPA: DNA mismatch repair protein MutS, partial [Candidatus Krumholzibacterium sp.]|nr:DNA mismatch repair protein MutS [Candidatus Krumholzibacterium sp.]